MGRWRTHTTAIPVIISVAGRSTRLCPSLIVGAVAGVYVACRGATLALVDALPNG
jgi:hypothetical protein